LGHCKKGGIIDGDFYLADLLSTENVSFKDRLLIVLQNNHYRFAKGKDEFGISLFGEIQFKDNQKAYNEFWRKYKRPPMEAYWDYIIERRDLLVPQDIREREGSFFTPQIWVRKSQEYLTQAFGVNWQDEYYIWDCAAGTGNILVGLTNKYNIWASTLDNQDIGIMRDRIKNGANLLDNHVFQFDFLNDSFDKLPESLRQIVADPEKRKKLIIYINPPYAEAGNQKMIMGGGDPKTGVSINTMVKENYQIAIGNATNDLSTQFMARIYREIANCKLAVFSKIKFVCAQNFIKFRDFFQASYKSGFVVPANTFDNVQGNFPIAFTIWDLNNTPFPDYISTDVLNTSKKKKFFVENNKTINHWIRSVENSKKDCIGYLICESPDFQKVHQPYITLLAEKRVSRQFFCNEKSLVMACIYLSVRLCIEATWLEDRDQFLYPSSDKYKKDISFHNDCIIFTLFHGQNRISAKDGINHWIPFTAQEVGAKDNFTSNFMSNYLKNRKFSREAKNVIATGRELWKYYHSKIEGNSNALIDASFYDIREFFQGRSKTSGAMNVKSNDDIYNGLIKNLRHNISVLADKLRSKVFEYGFLTE
jgi:hypothetical protein